MITVSSTRYRSNIEIFQDADAASVVAAYNAFEAVQAAITDKTKQVRVSGSGYNGTEYFIVAEITYPERADTPLGQVPDLV